MNTKKSQSLRRRQNIGLAAGSLLSLVVVGLWLLPVHTRWRTPGPMNVGHEELLCQDCHQPAEGTLRQQLQANARYLFGWRETAAAVGSRDVDNVACLACHDQPDDRHPVFRFLEPRFAEAREEIAPQFCLSCHLEHNGARVTVQDAAFCIHCHQETKVKDDPISTPHEELIAARRWETCLGCHDFHGNHVMETPVDVIDAFSTEEIMAYFAGGPPLYSNTKVYVAPKEGLTNE
ncbi:MAG: cytochrome c3 family protein [Chloroflexi bacterium]|nr:cytochrome c3 family protein [Chloroflexota bacterium]MCI0580339.1 cytochrome c3 family protein [Chloroflexota bacterium]MCI0648514.1 cytochrome c3 family protein [Chloroflexota bacterium]MCI0728506.1 cytochrome c3 family protein [Chloroflexota bacterium]